MRLASLRLQNFRSCRDVSVSFDDYTCLVGQNGVGKSTILAALNVFFRNTAGSATDVASLSVEDFCHRNTAEPAVISATFANLSEDEARDFASYVRDERLIIRSKARWDEQRGNAEVKQYGARWGIPELGPLLDEIRQGEAKVADLRVGYDALRVRPEFASLPAATTKKAIEEALLAFEEQNPARCGEVDSETLFYGWTKGANLLRKYVQWVYVPAVKDASSEQDESAKGSALSQLLQRTLRPTLRLEEPLRELRDEAQRRYEALVGQHQRELDDRAAALQARLRSWSHGGARVQLEWNTESAKTVAIQPPTARAKIGDDEFVGAVARMGHGLQRTFIVAMLQELAEHGRDEGVPRLLLGFEEPELYQHPPQARHLAGVLEELADLGAQVIVTTHSPYFVSGRGFESVRMVRRSMGGASATAALTAGQLGEILGAAYGDSPWRSPDLLAGLEQILQPSLNELFFCGSPVLVEGTEDIAFLATHLKLRGDWAEFRRLGCHFVVTTGKKSMDRPLAVANGFGVPAFAVFDADGGARDRERNHAAINRALLRLAGHDADDPFPQATVVGNRLVMWPETIADAVRADFGAAEWESVSNAVRAEYGYVSTKGKNQLLLAGALKRLHQDGRRSAALDRACDAILAFAAGRERIIPPEAGERAVARDARPAA